MPAAHTFVLRVWKETRADHREDPVWRGTVCDLHGRQLGMFSTAAELVGLIGERPQVDVLLRFSCVGGPAAV